MSGFPGWGEEEWGLPAFGGTAESMATEGYTVTLPEEPAEAPASGFRCAACRPRPRTRMRGPSVSPVSGPSHIPPYRDRGGSPSASP
ncbi:hypothetical protein GCM10027028_10310 [Streptomyces sundarbansensis]